MIKTVFHLEEKIAQRGAKFFGFIDLAQKVDCSQIRLPYMIVCGKRDGPVVLADCCVHGDEYEGAEAISMLYRELNPESLRGTFIGVPALNLEAFNAGSRVAPIDWSYQDMNRAFPGNPNGMISSRVAHFYFENFVRKADYVVSFHGGGNGLYLEPLATYQPGDSEIAQSTYRMAKSFGVPVLWRHSHLPFAGTLTIEAERAGIPNICVELGGQGIRHDHREEMIALAQRGLVGIMQEFGMLDGAPPRRDSVEVEIVYIHSDEGGYHKLACRAMDLVGKGSVISEVFDLFGEKVSEIKAPFDCYICGYWCYSTIHPGNWAFLLGKPVSSQKEETSCGPWARSSL